MKLRSFLTVAAASAALTCGAAAFAGGPEQPLHAAPPTMGGFYVQADFGGYHGTHEYDIHYDDANSGYGQHVINHGLQDSFLLGGGFGYGFAANGRFYFGVGLGAELMPHDANLTVHIDGPKREGSFDAKYDSEMNYALNFSVTPGVFINDATLMYAVMGASYGHVESQVDIVKNDGDKKQPLTCKDDSSVWGVVFGGGLRHYVTPNAAVFGEYDYYYYQNEKLADVSDNSAKVTYKHDLSIHGGAYKVGFLFNFF